jgi:hypothetical protein
VLTVSGLGKGEKRLQLQTRATRLGTSVPRRRHEADQTRDHLVPNPVGRPLDRLRRTGRAGGGNCVHHANFPLRFRPAASVRTAVGESNEFGKYLK